MCIYCTTNNYRKIYENHNGPIPRDEMGRKYHIHHIDGNRGNNSLTNLVALSIQEHYDIHYSQKDYSACHRLGALLNISAEEMSALSKSTQRKRIEDGTHHFLGESNPVHKQNPFLGGEIQRKSNLKRVKDGTHNWLGSTSNQKRIDNGTHHLLGENNPARRKVKDGTYHMLAKDNPSRKRSDAGTHNFLGENSPNKIRCSCIWCKKDTNLPTLSRCHSKDKCSHKIFPSP